MDASERPTKKHKMDGEEKLINWTPVPVLDDCYFAQPELVDVYVTEILHKKDASEILQKLFKIYPLPTLQHLKRIRSSPSGNGNLDIIITHICNCNKMENSDDLVTTRETSSLISKEANLSGLGVLARRISVSAKPPLTKHQYEFSNVLWPTLFHEDKLITKAIDDSLFSLKEKLKMEDYMRRAIGAAKMGLKENQRAIGCVIVDPLSNSIVAVAHDLSSSFPMKHAVMVAIELVAIGQGGESLTEEVLKQNCYISNLKNPNAYLCTNYDVYVTREPCTMCSMALVHCRIGRVFYGCENVIGGSLGSAYKIHTQKGLNHHFLVFKGILHSECKQLNN